MAGAKRAATADPVGPLAKKRSRIDSPITRPTPPMSRDAAIEDSGSVADTATTTGSTSRRRPKVYVCTFLHCSKAFDRPIRLQTHMNTHTGEKPFVCSEEGCDKKFYKAEHLKSHAKNAHSPPDQFCTYIIRTDEDGTEVECGKAFSTTSRLQRHLALHKDKEERKCEYCGQTFRKFDTLQRHLQKEHLEEETSFRCRNLLSRLPEPGDEGTWDDLDVEECGQTFDSAGKLQWHKEREHGNEARRYTCTKCPLDGLDGKSDNSMTREAVLEEHDDNSDRSPEAGATTFATYNELLAHIREAHPPTCSTCGTVCASNNALKAHIDIHHGTLSERQVHPCTWPGCDRSFTKKGNLTVHVQSVHVKARNYVCGTFDLSKSKKVAGWDGKGCGAALTSKSSLENHIQVQHMGLEKPQRPSRLRKKVKAENDDIQDLMPFLDLNSATPTEYTSSAATPTYMQTLGLLTGVGYADSRPFACFLADEGCRHRFTHQHHLDQHMDCVHGWTARGVEGILAVDAADAEFDDGFQREAGYVPKTVYGGEAAFAGWDEMFGEDTMALDPALL